MINLKTKSEKHNLDNEKRRRSIKEKEKAKQSQSEIIKQALSNATLNNSSSKKIVFNDDDDADDENGSGRNIDHKTTNGGKNCVLFGDSDSEEEIPTIKEKVQFSGKKGFELLNLQSTYGNDERFRIDERFLEDEKEETEKEIVEELEDKDDTDPNKEKKKMLNILGSVLGEPVQEIKKVKKRQFDMIRYDASKKEHEVYEIKTDPETTSSSKKKKLRKLAEADGEEPSKPQVSKEKFYKVSGEIKNSFKEKNEGGQFSLLQTYGADDVEDEQEKERQEEEMEEDDAMSEKEFEERGIKQRVEPKEEKKVAVAQGIWKENFFFEKNDPRFKDSFEFISKKNSTEAIEAAENYNQTRKKLKEILRLHMKKQLQKKDPFKNKIGGGNKKQTINFRPKSKFTGNKRKPPRMNPGGKV